MFERTSEILEFGPFRFDPHNGLWRGGDEVPLPPRALAVLAALLAQNGRVVAKTDLLDAGWTDAFVTEASLLEAIHVLRATLGDDRRAPRYIQTVHRRGYRFVAAVTTSTRPTMRQIERLPELIAAANEFPPFFRDPEWRLIVRRCGWGAAATMLTSLVMAAFGPRPVQIAPAHYSIALPPSVQVPPFNGSVSASPDGRRFAFVALDVGRPSLFVRDASRATPLRLEERAEPSDPFFSPDSRMVGYFAAGELKVSVPGGTPRTIAHVVPGAGATWINDRTIVFGGGPGGGLARVSVSGGPPEVLLQPEALSTDVRYGWPDLLPDDAGLILTVMTPAGSDVAVLEPGAARHRVLVRDAAFGRYAPTGHLIVERHGRLEAAPFDPVRHAFTGRFRPVVGDIATATAFEGPRFAFSRSGSLVYVPGPPGGPLAVRWRDGDRGDGRPFHERLAVVAATSAEEPPAEARALSAAWRPDGLEVAFAANKSGPYNLFVRPRLGVEFALGASPWNQVPTSWSPDGRVIAYTEFNPATGADVWVVDRLTGIKRPLARTPLDETAARFSPDGRWVAYLAKSGGEWQVVVVSARGGAQRSTFPAREVADAGAARAGGGHELRIVLAWFAELSQRMRGPA
jgi:DNA-binding winged helix-turn-helix (wHTH) protein